MTDKDILNELSELDKRDNKLRATAREIPAVIAELSEKLTGTENRLSETENEIEELRKVLRKSERTVEEFTVQLTRYNQQIMDVKTNKEYHSIQNEIESTNYNIGKTEENILEAMDRIEGLETEQLELKLINENERAPLLEKVARFRDELNDVEIQQIEVVEKRKIAIERLSPQMRGEYERLHERYNGEAVVPVIDGTCKGCFVNVPPQVIEKLYRGGSIIRCDSCGRFLYIEDAR